MVLKTFPNLSWLKQQAQSNFESRRDAKGETLPVKGWPNVILNVETSQTYRDNIRGPLTIFTNLQGVSHVEVDGRRTTIGEGYFYLSNHDQYYTLDIQHRPGTETFNVHFGEHFADQVFSALTQSETQLLEDVFHPPHERLAFHNRLSHRDAVMEGILRKIKGNTQPDRMWLEEQLFALIHHLLRNETRLLQARDRLPSIKSTTKAELLRRLLVATDYIHTYLAEDLSLDQLSSVACLSKFHFLRLFKVAFGKTPYAYINELRINRSREYLSKTNLEINEIARLVGFNMPGSFSRMFHHQVGVYPTQLRAAAR